MGARTSRPSSEPAAAAPVFNRRLFLGAGVVALGAAGLAACGGSSSSSGSGSGGGSATGEVTFGSNASDDVPKKAYASTFAAYKTSGGGGDVKVNTVDHNTFQEQINNYLQGRPDDVFTWFAGYRMRFFAKKGLVGDISDVWDKIGGGFSDAIKQASTGDDGKQYFVPLYNYPWAVHYRKSVFAAKGYQIPKTLDEMVALGGQMKKDGLAPLAFADKDGWPAMGTFDYLNMRINGYDFHINLMAGKEAWDSAKVATVFDTWKRLLEVSQPNSLGRTWQEAAQTVAQKKSGMYLLGTFVGQQFTAGAERDDLDFFPFPEVDSAVGTDAVEAPIDGFMMAKRPSNADGATKLLEYLGSAPAENAYLATDSNDVAVHKQADTSKYNALQKKASELIGGAKSISQFLDRDADPTFASTVAIPSFQKFIQNPNDAASIAKSMEAQKKSIYQS
jgi:multiple sugar transport system substrate-binding protein